EAVDIRVEVDPELVGLAPGVASVETRHDAERLRVPHARRDPDGAVAEQHTNLRVVLRRDALHRLSLCEAREYPRAQPRLFVGDAVHLDGGADLGAGVERIGRRTQERTFRVRTACGSLREERTSGRAVRLPVLRFSD